MKLKILYISAIIALMAVTGCSKSPEQGNEQSNSAISQPKAETTKENEKGYGEAGVAGKRI